MNMDLSLAIPHNLKCWSGYIIAGAFLLAGIVRIFWERRAKKRAERLRTRTGVDIERA